MTGMDDRATWFRAQLDARERQLDEDERVARAVPATRHRWHATGGWPESGPDAVADEGGRFAEELDDRFAEHIARWDPARVLAEIADERRDIDAKRQIVQRHHADEDACRDDGYPMPCPTLRLLALPYADKEGYRPEWRPDGS